MRPRARSASRRGPAASAAAVRAMDDRGWKIAAIELQQPSLDDVFLSITGRPLRIGPKPRPPTESRMSAVDRASRERMTLGETFADSRVMAVRQLRKILRRPMYVVYLFVQPVIFVLLFRYVFGGAIHTGRVSYVNYLLPGIIAMTATFGALTTGLGITEDLSLGVVDRLRSLPMARSAVLIGRTAADLVTNLITVLVMLAIGFAVGFRPSQPIYDVRRRRCRRARLRLRVLVDQRVRRGSPSRTPRRRSRSASSGCSRSCSPRRPSSPPRRCRLPSGRSPTSTR